VIYDARRSSGWDERAATTPHGKTHGRCRGPRMLSAQMMPPIQVVDELFRGDAIPRQMSHVYDLGQNMAAGHGSVQRAGNLRPVRYQS
jgi:hypothetical protein